MRTWRSPIERRFARCFCRYSGNIASDISYIIMTTGSAGGLFGPYKGAFTCGASEDALKVPPTARFFLLEP